MNYQLKSIEKKSYEAFNHNKEQATLLQSYDWGKIKSNWESLPFGFFKETDLIGTLLILKKRLPMGLSMLYIPKGPIMDFDREAILSLAQELKKIGKKEKSVFVKIDPPLLRKSFSVNEEAQADIVNEEIKEWMLQAGFEQDVLTLDLHATIQPRFQAVVPAAQFGLDKLTKKGRQGVQTAKKRGVIVEKHGIEKCAVFTELMKKTSERQGISLRGEHYFKTLLETYPEAFLMLGKIDPASRKNEVEEQLFKIKNELELVQENQIKKQKKLVETQNSLTKELTRLNEEITVHGSDPIYISGTLSIPYGQTCELLYAGMDDSFKHYMPAYYTWYAAIEEAFSLGYPLCNLGGVDGHLNDGLIGFKKNFQPIIQEFMGEFNLATCNRWMYRLMKKAYDIKTK